MACQCINNVPPSFQIKGDENRQELLNLGALEPLLKLVLSEDKVVRRNSTMCLGTMAQNGEWNCFSLFSNSGDSMVDGLRLAFQAFPVQVGLCVITSRSCFQIIIWKCPELRSVRYIVL